MILWDRPRKAVFELTNLCNLRCKMCGIWAEPGKKRIDTATFEKLLQDRSMKGIRHIALTGGEPFLLKDLESYYELAKKYFPKAYINISTNGFLTQRVLNFLNKVDIKKLSITISYDGIKSHDSIRMVEGSRERLLETAIKIKENFPKIELSLKMTVTNENYGEILETAKQCKILGVPFRFKTLEKLNGCHQSRYPAEIVGDNYSSPVEGSITRQAKEVLGIGIETNRKYLKMLIKRNGGKKAGCNCSPKNLFIGIDGNVFLCRKRESIGNIYTHSLFEIWHSEKKQGLVESMKNCSSSQLSYINE